jgi:hypothetical protein
MAYAGSDTTRGIQKRRDAPPCLVEIGLKAKK